MTALEATNVNHWADRIRPHLEQAVESIIAAGRELTAAKEALPHGQFGPLLDELGISPRTAQRFMRVAAHPVLSNTSRVSYLPPAIGTLEELSRWDDDELTAAIDSGEIHPGTTRAEAAGRDDRHQDAPDEPPDLDEAKRRVFEGPLGDGWAEVFDQYDLDADEIIASWATDHALSVAGRNLIRQGRIDQPPSWWQSDCIDGDARVASNRLREWELRVQREAGGFLTWCEAAGIKFVGRYVHFDDELKWPGCHREDRWMHDWADSAKWFADKCDDHDYTEDRHTETYFCLWFLTPDEMRSLPSSSDAS